MLNTLITFGLSILVFAGALHIDLHDQSHAEGYSICIPECDNEHHHSFFHQCEKCIIKQTKVNRQECFKITCPNNLQLHVYCNTTNNYGAIVYYPLYSRPPPNLI